MLGLTQALAQRYPPGSGGPVGRFQVVRANADVIVLLDTTTGDLYSAQARDIQPYNARFRSGGRPMMKDEFRDEKKDPDVAKKPDDFRKDEKKRFDEPKKDEGQGLRRLRDFEKKDPTKRKFRDKSDLKKDVDVKKGDFDKKGFDLKKDERPKE